MLFFFLFFRSNFFFLFCAFLFILFNIFLFVLFAVSPYRPCFHLFVSITFPQGTHTLASLNLPAPNDPIPTRPSSVPPTPSCTHEIRSPHSTSSNQGSDSLSGSEQTLNDTDIIGSMRYQRRIKPKVSSADSILAMFRNFASTNVISHIPSSMIISPSTTPSASSPQDDDESSTSSMHTSCAPDSPISSSYQKQHMQQSTSIEVPVIDSFSAHKTSSLSSINSSGSNNSNLLNPPSILLEIPSNINKCLSPIRELPTPIPSPALTPNMPRYHRFAGYQTSTSTTIHSTKPPDTYTNSFSDDDERITIEHSEVFHSLICSLIDIIVTIKQLSNFRSTQEDSI